MNHAGFKSVATEPTRLENKRERRRGAAGRAAVLRRAPSDSDCSGETASLSADSGDRAPRPPPQPLRSGKNRSRRRGSEWEVLEGLKDGQRFEKRPDVFNGYLHKKRKWPLKGWHKRFFVVDGGILVYARSPTDVARGRLHGSVDVGLSVISAKARRRRIDIDADEFIYHLRAKTPDVFRTWLNVLKTHRLYRQHLLTFGARESVPKIHAPLDDLPPTDTSSRASSSANSSISSSSKNNSHDYACKVQIVKGSLDDNSRPNVKKSDIDTPYNHHVSLCSMNCLSRRFYKRHMKRRKSVLKKSCNISVESALFETQMESTDLDDKNIDSLLVHSQKSSLPPIKNVQTLLEKNRIKYNKKPTRVYYMFAPNISRNSSTTFVMKRSNKSTNLVKYQNIHQEPTLKRPLTRCLLLAKEIKQEHTPFKSTYKTELSLKSNNAQKADSKSFHHTLTTPECDAITKRIMTSLLNCRQEDIETEEYIRPVIEHVYETKFDHGHPIKQLFRSLLEYWLKNTSVDGIRNCMTYSQGIDRQSNKLFIKDENLSAICIGKDSKCTQFPGFSDFFNEYKRSNNSKMNKKEQNEVFDYPWLKDTDSIEKEHRTQSLEKLIQNTIYVYEKAHSKEKDIKITKTLLDNIGKLKEAEEIRKSNSSCSMERIQETVNHLISSTSIPAEFAKGFLSIYLDVLLQGDRSATNSTSSCSSSVSKPLLDCDVQTEPVLKVAKSVSNLTSENINRNNTLDKGKHYMKNILDKVKSVHSKFEPLGDNLIGRDKTQNKINACSIKTEQQKDKLGIPVQDNASKSLINKVDAKAVVINLSRHDLHDISMVNDPSVKGLVTITLKVKERSHKSSESDRTRVKLDFSNRSDSEKDANKEKWLRSIPIKMSNSNELFRNTVVNQSLPNLPKEFDIKPYSSSTDSINKTLKPREWRGREYGSEHTFDLSFNSSNAYRRDSYDKNDQQHPCYIMSIRKEKSKFSPDKKIKSKEFKTLLLSSKFQSNSKSSVKESSLKFQSRSKSSDKESYLKSHSRSKSSAKEPSLPPFKIPTRVIDERFIILLLENLTLLSQNIPSLHKDIKNLYFKLKKKHEKIMKNRGQGLGLLGKIYNKETCGNNDENQAVCSSNTKEVACNDDEHQALCTHNTKEVSTLFSLKNNAKATNTNTVRIIDEITALDKKSSAISLKELKNTKSHVQTNIVEVINKMRALDMKSEAIQYSESQTTSNLLTKPISVFDELADTNIFKFITSRLGLERYKQMFETETPNDNFQADQEVKKRKLNPKTQQDEIKEMSILPPLRKISSQSQTARSHVRFSNEILKKTEFNVYSLFIRERFLDSASSAMSTSHIDNKKSDDLKTLYRRSSEGC